MEAKVQITVLAGDICAVIKSKFLYAELIADDPSTACAEAERFCQKLGLLYGKIEVDAEARRLNPSAAYPRAIAPTRQAMKKKAAELRQRLAARGAA